MNSVDRFVAVCLEGGEVVAGKSRMLDRRDTMPDFFPLHLPASRVACPYCDGKSVPLDQTEVADRTCLECRGTHEIVLPEETVWLPNSRIDREIGRAR